MDKTIIQKDTCTPMVIAALFTIGKTWKHPKCFIHRMDKDVIYLYTQCDTTQP